MHEPQLCTLQELRTVYTIDDLADMHEAMDEQAEYEARRAAVAKERPDA